MKIIVRLISAVLSIVTGIVINYSALPAWNVRSRGFLGFILVTALFSLVFFGVGEYILYEEEDSTPICSFIFGGIAVVVILVSLVGSLTGAQMFKADAYKNIIEFQEGDFAKDIIDAEKSEISAVDVATAKKLGDRTIGSIKNSPWFEVDDEYNLIIYKGKQYRLSPLNYGGFFKYRKAKYDGIPGYVLVDAITQKAEFVKTEEPIRYSPSACFSQNLKRHLRNQYSSYIFGEKFFFEIDEEGNPYYIVSVLKPTIGLTKGQVVTSFIIVDACSGECEEVKVEDLPEWVDHAYSVSYLTKMAYYHMEFVGGYWNHVASQTGVIRTTYSYKDSAFEGYNSIVGNDGVVFYTGLTPANASESNIGFITMNPRTGIIKKYVCDGAEESSAQSAAEGLVQNLGYTATFPNILNIEGNPVYFMALKDNGGLIKKFALCNMKNYAEVVEADTIEEVISKYKEKVGLTSKKDEPKAKVSVIKSKVEEIFTAQKNGNTYFYYVVGEKIYVSPITNSEKQVMLKIGDTVTLEFSETSENGVYSVSKITF